MPAPALTRDGNLSGEKMSRFFEMPPELRNEVYSYLGVTARLNRKLFDMVSLISAELDHCPSTSLLVVSKQFSAEYIEQLKRVISARTLTLDFGRTGRPGTTGTSFTVGQMLGLELTGPNHKSRKRLMEENSQIRAALASVSCLRVSINEHNVVLSWAEWTHVGFAVLDLLPYTPSLSTAYILSLDSARTPEHILFTDHMRAFCKWVFEDYSGESDRPPPPRTVRPARTMEAPLYSVYHRNGTVKPTHYQHLLQHHPLNSVTYRATFGKKGSFHPDISLDLLEGHFGIPKFEDLEAEVRNALDKIEKGEMTIRQVYDWFEMEGEEHSWLNDVD